jgi:hypothetical protein
MMRGILSIIFLASLVSEIGFARSGIYPSRFSRVPRLARTQNAAPRSEKLLYYGGPVISNARVVTVFWGKNVNGALQQNIGSFYAAIVNSNHMDWLDQYATFGQAIDGRPGTNQHLSRGSYVGEYVIEPLHTSLNLDDQDIQAEIVQQIAKNVLPAGDANTVYMIHFPAGMSITIEGMKSCQNFCAYHNASATKAGGAFFYGIIPDQSSGACAFGCGGFGNSGFDVTTMVSAHELIEAVTDPFPTPGDKPAYPQAWNTTGGEEIADLCSSGYAQLITSKGTYKISQEWDNRTASCSAGPFKSQQ